MKVKDILPTMKDAELEACETAEFKENFEESYNSFMYCYDWMVQLIIRKHAILTTNTQEEYSEVYKESIDEIYGDE